MLIKPNKNIELQQDVGMEWRGMEIANLNNFYKGIIKKLTRTSPWEKK